MRKIGILTYSREYSNLGTVMQCYSTLKAIQRAYPDARVEVIDCSLSNPVVRPYLSDVTFRSLTNDWIRIGKYRDFFRDELILSPHNLTTSNRDKAIEFIKSQHYDAIYVGSDTVLELKGAAPDRLNAYWLDETLSGPKFFMAASSHNVTCEALSSSQQKQIRETLNSFTLLGVRDQATSRLLSHFIRPGDGRLEFVPDPTFTCEIDYRYADQYFKRHNVPAGKPIVCLHLLRYTNWAAALAAYFRKQGYVVASLRPAHYADLLLTDLSPFEQTGIYRYFSLVITHRFHDSVFCLKNLTPVLAFPEHPTDVTQYGDSKLHSLFSTFSLQDTNYIARSDSLSAEYLIDRYQAAIEGYKDHRETIERTLQSQRALYDAFLARSAMYVQ